MLKKWILASMVMLSFGLQALGQALADRVPADAILYVGWSGFDGMDAAYGKSNLKKLVDQTNLEKNMETFIPALMKRFAEENPQEAPVAMAVRDLIPILWRRPCAMYFGGATMNQNTPITKFAMICDAGSNPAGLLKAIKDVTSKTGAPITAELHAGQFISIGVSYPVPESVNQLLDKKAGDSLANSPAFKASLGKVSSNSAVTFYLDSAKLTDQITTLLDANAPQVIKASWRTFKSTMTPEGVKRVIATCGFDGADWSTRLFIDAPAPRKGLASMLDAPPISPEMTQMIPVDSTYATATRMDLNGLIKTVVSVIGFFNPQTPAQFDSAMEQIHQATGVNFQDDLLASLGDEWGTYMSPSVAGNTGMGMVIVNKLANPAKFADCVKKLEKAFNAGLEASLKRSKISISIRTVTVAKNEVHYLTIPLLSPAFAIRDGMLFVGMYPQTVIAAMDFAASNGKNIADNPQFAAINKRLGGGKPTAFSYMDLPALAPNSYDTLLMIERLLAGFSDIAGIPMPEPMAPTLPQFMKVLTPSGSVSWSDDSGFYTRSVSSFPTAEILGSQMNSMAIGVVAIQTSVLLPALNSARERANRVKCASNLRQIGQAVQLYNADSKKYPANMELLITEVDLSPEVMLCPSKGGKIPPGLNPKQQAKWAAENSDYVYLGAAMKANMTADAVLAYEKPDNHDREGLNVLFNDGHVDWVPMRSFDQLMAMDKQIKGK